MSACTPVIPLKIHQGATFYEPISYFQDDEVTPVDLTGCTARLDIKSSYGASENIISLTTENGGLIILNPDTAPQIAINITHAQTADFDYPQTAVGDLYITYPDTTVEAFLSFAFDFVPTTNT